MSEKRCPFCNSDKLTWIDHEEGCYLRMITEEMEGVDYSPTQFLQAWNKRVENKELRELEEDLNTELSMKIFYIQTIKKLEGEKKELDKKVKQLEGITNDFGTLLSSRDFDKKLSEHNVAIYSFPDWKADDIDEYESRLFSYWEEYR